MVLLIRSLVIDYDWGPDCNQNRSRYGGQGAPRLGCQALRPGYSVRINTVHCLHLLNALNFYLLHRDLPGIKAALDSQRTPALPAKLLLPSTSPYSIQSHALH